MEMDYEQFLELQQAKKNWEEFRTFGVQTNIVINLSKLSKFYNKNPDLMVCPFTYNYRFNKMNIPENKLLLNEFQKDNFRVKQLGKLTNLSERIVITKMNRFKNGQPLINFPKSLPFY